MNCTCKQLSSTLPLGNTSKGALSDLPLFAHGNKTHLNRVHLSAW